MEQLALHVKTQMETVIDIDECPICMESGGRTIEELKCCRNAICEGCYNRLTTAECPFCRQPLIPVPTSVVVAALVALDAETMPVQSRWFSPSTLITAFCFGILGFIISMVIFAFWTHTR